MIPTSTQTGPGGTRGPSALGGFRRRVFAFVAVVSGALAALLAGEVAYRLWRSPRLTPTTHHGFVAHDELLGWAYRPGAKLRHHAPEFDVTVAINERGFRGPSWSPVDPARPLVLVLGDSFAFGWGVKWQDTLVARLGASRPDWDVRCAAVAGYGTGQQLLLLRLLQRELRPAVVVMVWCDNDLWESGAPIAYGRAKPWFALSDQGLQLHGTPVEPPGLLDASALFQALKKTLWERSFVRAQRDPEAEWALVGQIFLQAQGELAGVPLLLASPAPRLAAFAKEHGIQHADTTEAFAMAQPPRTFAVDGHWTAAGHETAARLLLPAIEAALSRR